VVLEAVPAVDRAIATRLEGKLRFLAAVGADRRERLAGAAAAAESAAAAASTTKAAPAATAASADPVLPGATARRTALRFVRKPPLLVRLLLCGRKHERLIAFDTDDFFVDK